MTIPEQPRQPGTHRALPHSEVVRLLRERQAALDTPDDHVARRLLSEVPDRPQVDRRSSSEILGSKLDPYESNQE